MKIVREKKKRKKQHKKKTKKMKNKKRIASRCVRCRELFHRQT